MTDIDITAATGDGSTTIAALQAETGRINAANGWREPIDPVIAELLAMQMLIVSEVAEATEEARKGYRPDENYYTEVRTGQGRTLKPEGVPSEIADIVIRCLDFADKYGIDLEAAIEEKLAYNATRGHRHGGKTI